MTKKNGIHEVSGSIPLGSTNEINYLNCAAETDTVLG